MNTDAYPIRVLPRGDFPPLLEEITDPPKKLYIRGSLPPPDHLFLTVVGSRKYSTYGKEATRALIEGLRGYPISIVSGLAIGIDGIAHEAALENSLHTVAVPGSGLDDSVLYPRTNFRLGQKILEAGGALLSEYEPMFHATTWSFPLRNRIEAGMSSAVLIVEAKERSGTLITARLATEYNRDVLTIPGSIFAGNTAGPHMLIRDGATPITSANDILEALNIKPQEKKPEELPIVDAAEGALLALLEVPCAKDNLIRRSMRPAHEANIIITMLELKGYIQEHDGIIMRIIPLS